MAMPTPVNGQITDAVTQTNVTVLSEAPSTAMGSVYQSLAHSLSLMYANSVSAQQNMNVMAQAASSIETVSTIDQS
ncbi:MAG: RebB family R body protein [Kordiimonas sp.]